MVKKSYIVIFHLLICYCISFSPNTNVELKLQSHFGEGVPKSIILEKNIAFLIAGKNIQLIDYSDPLKLDTLSTVRFFSTVNDLFLENETLFVIGDSLFVVNCRDLNAPQIISRNNYSGFSIKKYNDILFILNNNGIISIDSANILDMEILDEISWFYNKYNFEYDGKDIYISTADGIYQIDARDPKDLKLNLVYDTPSGFSVGHLALRENYLYATQSDRLLVFDIQDPESIDLIKSIQIWYDLDKIFLRNSIAYVTNRSTGLYTIDITNPSNPIEVGGYSTSEISDIFIDNNNIGWLLHSTYAIPRPIEIINTSTIWPQKIIDHDILPFYQDIACYDNFIFASFQISNKIVKINFEALKEPEIRDTFYTIDIVNSISIMDHTLYVCTKQGLEIYDITQKPILLSVIQTKNDCQEIAFKDNYCFMSQPNGMIVVDLFDLHNPKVISSYVMKYSASDISIQGSYVYLKTRFNNYGPFEGFKIIDISNPTNPIEVGSYPGDYGSSYIDIGVRYPYVFLFGNIINNLTACNVIDPSNITCQSVYSSVGSWYFSRNSTHNIVFDDYYAYCIVDGSGLHVINLQDINNANRINGYHFPSAVSIIIDEGNLFIADQYNGIFKFSIKNVTCVKNETNTNRMTIHNYPNPFNEHTEIKYTLDRDNIVSLKIYNTIGQLMETVFQETQFQGPHKISMNCINYPTGIYIVELTYGKNQIKHKMLKLQ